DEQAREAHVLLQIAQEVEDRRLHGYVEGGHRLVRDEHRGLDGERAREADPLSLTARELVRGAGAQFRPQPDAVEEIGSLPVRVLTCREPVQAQRLADDLPACQGRVEGRVRVLKDDVHAAPVGFQTASRKVRDVDAVKPDRPRGRLEEAHDAVRDRRLAAAGLADEPEHLARGERERDVFDGVNDGAAAEARTDREVLHQPFDLERRGDTVHTAASTMPGWTQATRCWARTLASGGSCATHCSLARGQRGAKVHSSGRTVSDGTRPGISCRRRAPRRGSAPSRPIVYGCCGEAKRSCTSASSTFRPAYMTTTRSAISATTPTLSLPPLIA